MESSMEPKGDIFDTQPPWANAFIEPWYRPQGISDVTSSWFWELSTVITALGHRAGDFREGDSSMLYAERWKLTSLTLRQGLT
jgi:hypothetical protein